MAKEREIPWHKTHPWMRAAYNFGKANDSWFAVTAGSEEHKSWARYFADLGWTPKTFLDLGPEQKEWTAPCQWPEWLTISADDLAALPADQPLRLIGRAAE